MQFPAERRSFWNAVMPVLPSATVAGVRLSIAWVLCHPTLKQGAVLDFNREFVAQTLVWSIVSLLTSTLFRLRVDKRVLFTGRSAGDDAREMAWHQREYCVAKSLFITFVICAGLDSARPGTMGFICWILLVFYLFAFMYLSVGWMRELASGLE